jgi:hypothetical protein
MKFSSTKKIWSFNNGEHEDLAAINTTFDIVSFSCYHKKFLHVWSTKKFLLQRLEVITAVAAKSSIFWEIVSCILSK